MSSITRCAPEAVHIGMKVRAAFRRVADDTQLPVFEPDESTTSSKANDGE